MYEKIVSVKPIGKQKTYDLEIDSKEHNFFANDICVSNSHAVCYSYITYQTLFLKYYYPAYFYSAMINIAMNIADVQIIIGDAVNNNNIKILPQSVKESEYKTRAIDLRTIRLGFGMIKGMGDSTIEECNSFRSFNSLSTLLKSKLNGINKTNFKNLIDLGAFDDYEIDREDVLKLKDLYQDDKIANWFTRKKQPLRLETLPKTLSDLFAPELCLKLALKAKFETETSLWDDEVKEVLSEKPWDLLLKYLLETFSTKELDKEKYNKITGQTQKDLMGFSLMESPIKVLESSLRLKGLLPLTEYEDEDKKYYFVVEKIEKGLTKTGKTYLKLLLDNGIKAKCWRDIELLEGEVFYGLFKKDNFGFTLNDRECIKAI